LPANNASSSCESSSSCMPNPQKEPERALTSSGYTIGTIGSVPKSRVTTIPTRQTRPKRRQTTIGYGAVSKAVTINYVSFSKRRTRLRPCNKFKGVAMPLFHPGVDILRYREGDLDEEKKRSVDKHIQECAECREYLAFVDDVQAGLQELTPEELVGMQTHLEPELIYDYEQGKLDDKSARELRAHMVFCDTCTDELYALRRLHHPRSFTQAVIRFAKKAFEIVDISGTGEVLETAL